MKQIKFMAAIAVAGLMMASCAKEYSQTTDPSGESAKVRIQIVYDQNTRAEGSAISDDTSLELKAGHIFFCDAAGKIYKHVGIGNSAGSVQVTLAEITNPAGSEAVISDINTSANKCYIVSNDLLAGINGGTGITGDLGLGGSSNISTVLAYTANVSDINDATGGVVNVPLYGVGTVDFTAGGTTSTASTNYQGSVTVNINSLASRIQIKKISGVSKTYVDASLATQTVTIDNFKLEGIYVNNFYSTMTVGSTLATLVNNGQISANYATTLPGLYAPTTTGANLADYYASGIADASKSVVPVTASKVWAYNVFPSSEVPHIVIKLSEVKFTDSAVGTQTTLTDQFITVKNFKYAAGHSSAGDVVASFEPNNIYTFGDIQFDYTNLSAVPEAESISVLVSVQMMKWLDNAVVWSN